MKKYLKVDNKFIDLTRILDTIDTLLIEVNEDGTVSREVGLNKTDQIIHKYPSKDFRYGRYGIFDLASISLSKDIEDDFTEETFEKYWEKPYQQ